MPNFKPNLLSMAILAFGAISLPTYAQDASSTEDAEDALEEVVVTGFRQSLVNALDKKRASDMVTEQLSADDLGGLPDVSMADALTRLLMVSLQCVLVVRLQKLIFAVCLAGLYFLL